MDEAPAVLPVGPWALAAVATVLVVALSVPPGGPRTASAGARAALLAGRVGAVLSALGVLGLVAAARLGPAGELDNPVPALVVGLLWPLLLLVPGLLGLLRPAIARAGTEEERDARPALLGALAVAAFLVLPVSPTRPAAVATALGAYALVVLAGCVAFGRRAVAQRFEVLGLLVTWGVVGRRLPDWRAPRGATAVLAVVLGAAWFERYERSAAWTGALPSRADTAGGLLLALLVAGAAAALLSRAVPGGGAAAVLLPLACATAAAGVLRRALISAQLLADQALGDRAVVPDPLGVSGGQALALALVTIGGALSAAVLARRAGEGADRLPGVGVLLALTGCSAWVVLQP